MSEDQATFPTCVLRATKKHIEFVVNGTVVQKMRREDYKSRELKLSSNPTADPFPLEAEGGILGLRLPPLFEMLKSPAALCTDDGLTYARLYRIAVVEGEGDARSVKLVDARTNEPVGSVRWPDMVQRVRLRALRSGTSYKKLLGEYDPALYKECTGKPYKAKAETPEEDDEAAEEDAPAKKEKEPRAGGGFGGGEALAWLSAHPMVGVVALVIGLILGIKVLKAVVDDPEPMLGKKQYRSAPPPSELDRKVAFRVATTQELNRAGKLTPVQKSLLADLREEQKGLAKLHPDNARIKSWGELLSKLEGKKKP